MLAGDRDDAEATLLRRLAPIADEHGGLISVAEAERAGISNRMLLHYASTGDLERMHRGVYRMVWYPRHRFADVIAACLRVGDAAVAVDDTAAAVWGLGDAMPPQITIGLPRRWRGRIPGARVVVRDLADSERTVRDDVPVTTIERTLADLAHTDAGHAADIVHDARRTGQLTDRVWRRATMRYPQLAALSTGDGGRR